MIIRTLSQTRPLLFSALLLKVGLAFAYSVPFVSEQAGELEMQLHMAQPTGEIASAPDAAQLQQALRLVEAGKLSEALQIAQRSVATFPNSAASQEILGVVLGLSGDIANSRKAFEKALSIESRRWTAMVKLGDLAYAEKQIKQAETQYRAAAAINPADGQLAQRLGLIEVANGNLTAAASQFEKGVAVLQDDVVSVRPYLGAIYNLRGEYQRTLDLFKSVPLDKVKHYAAYMVVAEAKFRLGKKEDADAIGLTHGLSVSEYGGDILDCEVSVVPGKGKLVITGLLEKGMEESAQAAMSYIRSRGGALSLEPEFYQKIDVHVHFPDFVRKDGPSAGVTMATSIASALTRIPVKNEVAMTGEITLRGRVMPIGGLKEKLLAAHRNGIKTVLIPKDNRKDLREIPRRVLKAIRIVLVDHMDDVLREALRVSDPEKMFGARRLFLRHEGAAKFL